MLDAILNLLYLHVTYCKKRNVSKNSNCPGQGGMKHLYGKNRPAQAGIPVAVTGIPARRDGTKNVPPPYKQYAIKTIETSICRDLGHRPVPVNVPSRLSYKQALGIQTVPHGDFPVLYNCSYYYIRDNSLFAKQQLRIVFEATFIKTEHI